MIRACSADDLDQITAIINEAAEAYRGIIADDRWHDPYMSLTELAEELAAGVEFWGVVRGGQLSAVMGLQHVADVALIRHAYTRPAAQGNGLGGALLEHLRRMTRRPILVGTWAAATWAVRFYEARGFRLLPADRKAEVLRRYWTIPERQIEESVVLGDASWWSAGHLASPDGTDGGEEGTEEPGATRGERA